MGRRRCVVRAAAKFHTNLLSTEMLRATGTVYQVPVYCPVSCKTQLLLMVTLCGEDKSLIDFGICSLLSKSIKPDSLH